MGYASFGDNPRAEEMPEWARIRFDGTRGPTLPDSKVPENWRTQAFEGGMRPAAALDFMGPAIAGNPFKGGFDFQGWSYGSEEYSRMIDYTLVTSISTRDSPVSRRATPMGGGTSGTFRRGSMGCLGRSRPGRATPRSGRQQPARTPRRLPMTHSECAKRLAGERAADSAA
jgi:hypothetical protein